MATYVVWISLPLAHLQLCITASRMIAKYSVKMSYLFETLLTVELIESDVEDDYDRHI